MMKQTYLRVESGEIRAELHLNGDIEIVTHGRRDSQANYYELISEQLDAPISYPPVMHGILEGDTIAIAIEDDVPDGTAVVMATAEYLCNHGVSPELISIVVGSGRSSQVAEIVNQFSLKHPEIRVVIHDPKQQDSHAYVAASDSADPIYVQRELIDADVTIPIYCVRTADCPNASDMFGIAPNFTDVATQNRWNLAWLEDNETHLNQHSKLSLEVGWLAGIHFAIAVVPSVTGHVSQIFAGKPSDVFAAGSRDMSGSDRPQCDLVVAIVEGTDHQQNWLSVARAAAQAEQLCGREGRIVVVCDVKKVSRGIRDLARSDLTNSTNQSLLKSNAEDAFPAAIIRAVQQNRSLYLFSSITASQTEALGMAYVGSAETLQHLIEQASNVCVIRGAQY
ncbi:MAG: lactate racemase domain-containing protein [Pirellula sp.]|jgi:nickel-dependent lactate racemase